MLLAPLLVFASLLIFPLGTVRQSAFSQTVPQLGDDRLGFVWVNGPGYANADFRYQQAVAAGAHWTRWPLYWQEIETSPGVRDYRRQDAVVNADAANGLKVNGILVGTPSWVATSGLSSLELPRLGQRTFPSGYAATALDTSSAASVPSNLYLPVFTPSGAINPANYWASFVYDTVLRYKGKVAAWEIWNEPDLKYNGVGVFWSGRDQDYVRLLKVGYQAAKLADPSVTVLFSGLAYWTDTTFFPRILSLIVQDPEAKANGYFFEGLPYHLYTSPYLITDFAVKARAQMKGAGIPLKPLWVNETNTPVCNDAQVYPSQNCNNYTVYMGTLEEQAAFAIQAVALAVANGVDKVFLFQLYDDGLTWPDVYGVVRNTGSPRPAYNAFKAAATYLTNPLSPSMTDKGNVQWVSMYSAVRGKVTVVWNKTRSDANAAIPAATTSAELRDKYGTLLDTIYPSQGTYKLLLPRATGLHPAAPDLPYVGGDPFILIEKVTLTNRVIFPVIYR